MKKLKESKVGAWLKDKAPKVLEIVSDLTGIEALDRVGDLIKGESMSLQDKLEFERLLSEERMEVMRLEVERIKNAQDREVGVVQATGKPDYFQWLVGSVGLGVFAMIVINGLFYDIENEKVYFHLLGIVEGIVLGIFGYYFGSSLGSKNKDNHLKNILK
jgi:hypothetical protein